MFCARCAALARHYAPRVRAQLATPPPEWMRAMGYDADPRAFARACETWKQTLRAGCPPHPSSGTRKGP